MLFNMLANRIYLGEIVHKGDSMPGEHDALIPPELWDEVQQTIAQGKVERTSGINLRAPSLLAGILRDGLGRRMSPSHAVKSVSATATTSRMPPNSATVRGLPGECRRMISRLRSCSA